MFVFSLSRTAGHFNMALYKNLFKLITFFYLFKQYNYFLYIFLDYYTHQEKNNMAKEKLIKRKQL